MQLGSAVHRSGCLTAGDVSPLGWKSATMGSSSSGHVPLPQKVHHFHNTKCFGSLWFLGRNRLFSLQRKSNLPAGESSPGHSRESATRIANGVGRLLQREKLEERRETRARLAGRERFRNDYVVVWKPDRIFKTSELRAISREGNRPLLCPNVMILLQSIAAGPDSPLWQAKQAARLGEFLYGYPKHVGDGSLDCFRSRDFGWGLKNLI
jgi:hypothetical protein